jgi:Flp pilus assembly protein TadD
MTDAVEWLLISLEEKIARRHGVPTRVPVPKGEFEGLADSGFEMPKLKRWITAFLDAAPSGWRFQNAELATAFDRFLAKVDSWGKAQNAFAKHDYQTAISSLKLISNLDPDDHAAKMNLASALASTGDNAAALKILEGIRPTFEGDADYHTNLGQLQAASGNRSEALDELVLALEAKPDHTPALEMLKQLGALVTIYEDPKDATSLTYVRTDSLDEYITSVWDKEPRGVDYLLEQAAYHASEDRNAIALAAAERAYKLSDPPDPRAEAARIAALRALEKKDEALAAAKAFAARSPNAIAHAELAQALRLTGDEAGAKAEIERALALDPNNLVALDLAFWPKDKQDLAFIRGALPKLQEFVNAHTGAAGAWRSLARAKLALGAIDEGLQILKDAVKLAKDDDDLRAEYWTELARQGRHEDVLADAATVPDMAKRDWRLRWNEAEALLRAGKKIEARAAFTQINMDSSLLVDVRRRAKRAVKNMS